MKIKLRKHQQDALDATAYRNRVAYYHTMGSGKTFTGSEKLVSLHSKYSLVVCQKSKVEDWVEHFQCYYPHLNVIDYTKKNATLSPGIIVINYDMVWRKPELTKLPSIALLLDESSMIKNANSKRTKFIREELDVFHVILLSGTPCGGKYEQLWSQCKLLGWDITKREFYDRYCIERAIEMNHVPYPIKIVVGYKNVEELKTMLRSYGAHFIDSDDLLDLPEQTFTTIHVPCTSHYKTFIKKSVVNVDDQEYIGATSATKLMYARMLCAQHSKAKLEAFADLLESTEERLIVFYNFKEELKALKKIAKGRPISEVNGSMKDLSAYEDQANSVTFIQYQSGAMGLNLQKANKIVYFSLPLSSELYEQSKKRTHRMGQEKPCFYYNLICKGSVEEKILATLAQRRNYTEALFIENN